MKMHSCHFLVKQFQMGGGPSAFGIYMFSLHWYFLISSYYLTVSNGLSLTALSSVEVTQSSGSTGGSICLWCLHVFSMCWYFLISSYYLTVSIGCSLTALNSVEVTQSSGSFKWGGLSAFGICNLIYTGISLYFLIIS